VTKAIVHVGPPPNANCGAETMIAIEKVVAMPGQSAGAKRATGTSASAMRDAVRTVHVMLIDLAAKIARAMQIGHAMPIVRAAQVVRVTQIGRIGLVHLARSVRWAVHATATSAHCSAGSILMATTC
jgi:hypothetical protein